MSVVVITGIGWATSLGHSRATVRERLLAGQSGIQLADWPEAMRSPVKLWAPVLGFDTRSDDPEDWQSPADMALPRDILRGLSPSGFYAFWAVAQALQEAGLTPEALRDGCTGIYSASSGSARMMHRHLNRIYERGVMGGSPMGVLASVVGTLNFNLAAFYGITGHSCGFASACASSGHAIGMAYDAIAAGTQDRMIVVGAEDDTAETILPFASMRALSTAATPADFRGPFDAQRSGFVGTGGAVVLVLERREVALARGARIYGNIEGWGQATDGYHPAKPHPEGAGLMAAMRLALAHSGRESSQIDYINAHATATTAGDLAELKAIRGLYPTAPTPYVSSTKGQTGHGLSLASALEAALTLMILEEGFIPAIAGLKSLDPIAQGVRIVDSPTRVPIKLAMSNSSGFGGANVALILSTAK
jgi:3-oxoacyl-[acyl-carrier-protein] synthase I